MQYRIYGKTKARVSLLGFGAMRLPMNKKGKVDLDKSTEMMRFAYEHGVNIFDSHPNYCSKQSETAIGIAMEGIPRDTYFIQTKNHLWKPLRGRESYRSRLERSLKALKTDYIDFYLAHSLTWEDFRKAGKRFFREMNRARDEGLIRHIGMSTHDNEENVIRLLDTGLFECMLCQYNLLDLSNHRPIAHAYSNGIGVSVMGPVGGGRLAFPSLLAAAVPGRVRDEVAAALRFVFSNRYVSTAFSGMSELKQVRENIHTASTVKPLSAKELARIRKLSREKKALADLYCTGCGYCTPCPKGVAIPEIFQYMNWKRLYGLNRPAREAYARLVKAGKGADRCVECGQCEKRCPQNIPIIRQLKESHKALFRK